MFYQRTKFHPPPSPGTPSTDGRTGSRARDLKRSNGHCAKTSHRKWFKFGTQTPRDMFYQRTEFHPPPFIRSIGSPFSISPLPVFFAEGRGTHRPQSPRPPRSFSQQRHGQTERERNSKFCGQMFPVTIHLSTKFHDHPIIPSIGSPVSIFPLPVPPDLFGRGPRGLSASSALTAAASSPVFFSWTARANGEEEKAAIFYPDPSGQQLALHQISSRSVHAFYGLPVPYLFSPGLSDLFHRAPRASTASVASAFSPVFFSWTARANGERETAAIRYPDLSGHKLALHQVSSRSVHAFYRRSLPYLFSPGLPDLFHRGPRSFYRPFRPKTIKRTLRENQPREMVQIWYTDTS